MSKLKPLAVMFLMLCLCVIVVSSGPINHQDKAPQGQKNPNFERFPIVDYLAAESVDPTEQEKRTKRAKKHNVKYAPRIDQLSDSTFLINDWDVNLPALPVERSAAVIIGRVDKAEAQLSENKTGVFTVKVETILKNDTKTSLHVDKAAVVVRVGGRVRLPSGKIIVSAVNNQDMPETGSKYVLFLTHHSLHGGEDEDFYILTGYEIKEGKAFPLDNVSAAHPISKYTGVSEIQLLADLSSALARL